MVFTDPNLFKTKFCFLLYKKTPVENTFIFYLKWKDICLHIYTYNCYDKKVSPWNNVLCIQ